MFVQRPVGALGPSGYSIRKDRFAPTVYFPFLIDVAMMHTTGSCMFPRDYGGKRSKSTMTPICDIFWIMPGSALMRFIHLLFTYGNFSCCTQGAVEDKCLCNFLWILNAIPKAKSTWPAANILSTDDNFLKFHSMTPLVYFPNSEELRNPYYYMMGRPVAT